MNYSKLRNIGNIRHFIGFSEQRLKKIKSGQRLAKTVSEQETFTNELYKVREEDELVNDFNSVYWSAMSRGKHRTSDANKLAPDIINQQMHKLKNLTTIVYVSSR